METLNKLYRLYKTNQNGNVYSKNTVWVPRLTIDTEKLYCSYKSRQVTLNTAEMELIMIFVVFNIENVPYKASAIQKKLISLKKLDNPNLEYVLEDSYIRKLKQKVNLVFKKQYGDDFDFIKSNKNGYWLSINPADINVLD